MSGAGKLRDIWSGKTKTGIEITAYLTIACSYLNESVEWIGSRCACHADI